MSEKKWHITVGVALKRPPTIDEYRHYVVACDDPVEAEVIARQIASCTSVMPVWSALEL